MILWSFNVLQELRERVLRGKYRIPFYMSTDCENLLKKFLILNPLKRYTLEVRFHLFFKIQLLLLKQLPLKYTEMPKSSFGINYDGCT